MSSLHLSLTNAPTTLRSVVCLLLKKTFHYPNLSRALSQKLLFGHRRLFSSPKSSIYTKMPPHFVDAPPVHAAVSLLQLRVRFVPEPAGGASGRGAARVHEVRRLVALRDALRQAHAPVQRRPAKYVFGRLVMQSWGRTTGH